MISSLAHPDSAYQWNPWMLIGWLPPFWSPNRAHHWWLCTTFSRYPTQGASLTRIHTQKWVKYPFRWQQKQQPSTQTAYHPLISPDKNSPNNVSFSPGSSSYCLVWVCESHLEALENMSRWIFCCCTSDQSICTMALLWPTTARVLIP